MAAPQMITPAYIREETDRQRPWTTYGKMNEWQRMPGGREVRSGVPVTMSDGNWQQPAREEVGSRQPENDYNAKFRDSYVDLTSKIAYRFPNPGLPRLRQGRIGGSWRHIKEVLGHGGSRVCYVDGLVAVYDEENFNQKLQEESPFRPHLRRQVYSANRGNDHEAAKVERQSARGKLLSLVAVYDEENFNQKLQEESPYRPHLRRQVYSANRGYDHEAAKVGRQGGTGIGRQCEQGQGRDGGVTLPAVEELPMMSTNERARKLAIQSPNKSKGVYAYNNNYRC